MEVKIKDICKVSMSKDDMLIVQFPNNMSVSRAQKMGNQLKDALDEHFGFPVGVLLVPEHTTMMILSKEDVTAEVLKGNLQI